MCCIIIEDIRDEILVSSLKLQLILGLSMFIQYAFETTRVYQIGVLLFVVKAASLFKALGVFQSVLSNPFSKLACSGGIR